MSREDEVMRRSVKGAIHVGSAEGRGVRSADTRTLAAESAARALGRSKDAVCWRCDACGYITPNDTTPDACPACDVGPDGSWTGTETRTAMLAMHAELKAYRAIERGAYIFKAELDRALELGDRLAASICALDSYAAASFPCPLDRSQEADAAVRAWRAMRAAPFDAATSPTAAPSAPQGERP